MTVCDIIALPYCGIAYFTGRELFDQFKLIGRSAHAQKLHPLFNGPHPPKHRHLIPIRRMSTFSKCTAHYYYKYLIKNNPYL